MISISYKNKYRLLNTHLHRDSVGWLNIYPAKHKCEAGQNTEYYSSFRHKFIAAHVDLTAGNRWERRNGQGLRRVPRREVGGTSGDADDAGPVQQERRVVVGRGRGVAGSTTLQRIGVADEVVAHIRQDREVAAVGFAARERWERCAALGALRLRGTSFDVRGERLKRRRMRGDEE